MSLEEMRKTLETQSERWNGTVLSHGRRSALPSGLHVSLEISCYFPIKFTQTSVTVTEGRTLRAQHSPGPLRLRGTAVWQRAATGPD